MDESPRKKKIKLVNIKTAPKRESENEIVPCKRSKSDAPEDGLQSMKRKNFITACEEVSYKAYFDYHQRLHLLFLPSCVNGNFCKHYDKNHKNLKPMPVYAEESFKIEMKTNMWSEALDVCTNGITPNQHLSSNVLKDIIEIMMNAHEDEFSSYSVMELIQKCQNVLSQNFIMHPPCLIKSLRKCYNDFLTSPMELRENTFSNRKEFDCSKGVVKYCMTRLEYEVSLKSKDEALVDKYENVPEEMKQSVKGIHWQKEKFEIFELLDRPDRIKRLMAVLESIVELLQLDLAIWHSRYTNNLGSHIMRSHKPLMAFILWSNNVLYTGAVNNNCRQILRIFVHFIHLHYPEEYIRIMTIWLNTIIQTYYMCENNSSSDYPNIGKYCTAFSNEFYKIIADMPQQTILKVLERVQPTYMQYLLGFIHLKNMLSTKEDDILKMFLTYVEKKSWKNYPVNNNTISFSKKDTFRPRKVKSVLKYLSKKCKIFHDSLTKSYEQHVFTKFDPNFDVNEQIDQNDLVMTFYLTLEAFLDSYNVQNVQETLENLNEKLLNIDITNAIDISHSEYCNYTITEHFIKKYRTIYQLLKQLMLQLHELRNSGELPNNFKIFEKVGLLGFEIK